MGMRRNDRFGFAFQFTVVVLVTFGCRKSSYDLELPDSVESSQLQMALAAESLPLDSTHTDVLLAAVCTLRRDRLEPYGHGMPTSPFLDLMADAGSTMTQNFTQAPWTRPSMASLFTGVWPRALKVDDPTNGVTDGGTGGLRLVLGSEHRLLAEALAEEGYHGFGAVANPNLMAQFGFAQGFESYSEPTDTWTNGGRIPPGDELVDWVIDQVSKVPSDQRIYVRLVLTDSHTPRRYPERYLDLFSNGAAHLDDYDASVRQVDALLARVFVAIKNLRPNLLFVMVADHGEGLSLPDHHGPGHGNYLYRSTTQTPMIWHHPALPFNQRVDALTMNLDVHPTILELLGVAPSDNVNGKDLSALLRSQTDRGPHNHVFMETFFKRSSKSAVFDGEHHLIRDRISGAQQMFSREDVGAHQDVLPALTTNGIDLSTALNMWETNMTELADGVPEETHGDMGETLQMLKIMGYVE